MQITVSLQVQRLICGDSSISLARVAFPAMAERTVATALGRGKAAQANHVPTLHGLFEANCRGPFPGVRETQNFGKHAHDMKFVCTACGRSVAIDEVRAHPVLHVGICKHCYNFQVSDPFTRDDPQDPFWHENECRWCGDGGFEMILCDSCPKVFCKYCIKRNFGEKILSAIESPPREWNCFVCNDEHLQILHHDHLQTTSIGDLEHLQTLHRDHMQATLIGDLLQALVRDYNNAENLVKTMKRRGQPQKSKMSRFEGDTDEENSNNQSRLPGSPLHHQDEHKNAKHLGQHPSFFCKRLTACNIGRSDRGVESNTGQFVFPLGFINNHAEQIQAFVKLQGIHEDSPTHFITCRTGSKDRRKVHLLPFEWSRFVKDNDLKEGQSLQFSLVADSCFVVREV